MMTPTAFMRPVSESDFAAIHAMALSSGGGMTNLPADEKTLKGKIDSALESFARNAVSPNGEFYMLVMDVGGKAVGTAAVFASIGASTGFVNYKVNREFYFSISLNKRFERAVLVPTHDFTDSAEVGSLFMAAEARGARLGKLLARSRYMFIAQKPEIVAPVVCAELRGWRAPDGAQPFWNAVGRRFFAMDFEEADAYNAAFGNQFIEDLMPRYPIYVDMLPPDARSTIGKPHDGALPAYKMLLDEGFLFNNYIDVFDGGPLLDTKVENLRAVRESRVLTVREVVEKADGPDALLASGAIGTFRALRAKARIDGDGAFIGRDAAKALNLEPGTQLRWTKW